MEALTIKNLSARALHAQQEFLIGMHRVPEFAIADQSGYEQVNGALFPDWEGVANAVTAYGMLETSTSHVARLIGDRIDAGKEDDNTFQVREDGTWRRIKRFVPDNSITEVVVSPDEREQAREDINRVLSAAQEALLNSDSVVIYPVSKISAHGGYASTFGLAPSRYTSKVPVFTITKQPDGRFFLRGSESVSPNEYKELAAKGHGDVTISEVVREFRLSSTPNHYTQVDIGEIARRLAPLFPDQQDLSSLLQEYLSSRSNGIGNYIGVVDGFDVSIGYGSILPPRDRGKESLIVQGDKVLDMTGSVQNPRLVVRIGKDHRTQESKKAVDGVSQLEMRQAADKVTAALKIPSNG